MDLHNVLALKGFKCIQDSRFAIKAVDSALSRSQRIKLEGFQYL